MAKRTKPKPISMSLVKEPARKKPASPPELPPFDPAGTGPLNQDSPLVTKQIARTNRAVENLASEVKALRDRPEPTPAPVPVVNIAPRPLIKKISIKYDQLGFPSELIPQYTE